MPALSQWEKGNAALKVTACVQDPRGAELVVCMVSLFLSGLTEFLNCCLKVPAINPLMLRRSS